MDSWRGENISEPLQDVQGVSESSGKYAHTDPTEYQLCIRGCNNKDDVHSIQENVTNLVAEFANVYSIEFLDGITIARDYVALMRSIAQNFQQCAYDRNIVARGRCGCWQNGIDCGDGCTQGSHLSTQHRRSSTDLG